MTRRSNLVGSQEGTNIPEEGGSTPSEEPRAEERPREVLITPPRQELTTPVQNAISSGSTFIQQPLNVVSFDGEQMGAVYAWIRNVEHQFKVKKTPEEWKYEKAIDTIKGSALSWLSSSQQDDEVTTWVKLKELMVSRYGIPDLQRKLRRDLLKLKQDSTTSEYVNKFINIRAQITNISVDDEMAYFEHGLKNEIKTKLHLLTADTLKELIIQVSRIEASDSFDARICPPTELGRNNEGNEGLYHLQGRNRTTKSFKCNFCHKTGHLEKHCWKKNNLKKKHHDRKREPDDIEVLNSLVKHQVDNRHRPIEGLLYGRRVKILIDSGATNSFINLNLSSDFQARKLRKRIVVTEASGKKYSISTEVEVDLNFGPFKFRCKLLPFNLAHYDVILGLDWLSKFNPKICWKTGEMIINDKSFVPKLYFSPISNEHYGSLICEEIQDKDEIFLISETKENQVKNKTPQKLQKLFKKYENIFGEELKSFPKNRSIKHEINTGDNDAVAINQYRLSPLEKQTVEDNIKKLLELKFIQPSNSPWSAPILFVKKKDGTLRMCLDYRKLNSITKKSKYPIPRVDVLLDSLKGARIFSRLDLCSGYYQVEIEDNSVEKTAFRTENGHYEFRVMPFGLTNAPATFMTLMNSIFSDIIGKYVIIYLDDILIYSETMEKHVEHLECVFKRLKDEKLTVKLSKCEFLKTELIFLGFKVTENAIVPDPNKIEAIMKINRPKSLTEVRAFLGLINFYRKFIPNCSEICSALTDLTKKDKDFFWNNLCEVSFEKLKESLCKAPCLQMPDFEKQFIVTTDASSKAIGGVLSQYVDGIEKPIAYESKRLSSVEENYAAHELELYAILRCLKVWRCYLEGNEFIIRTDHASLKFINKQKFISRRMTRWIEQLQQFNFIMEYKPGKTNVVADYLSRAEINLLEASDWPSLMPKYLSGIEPEGRDKIYQKNLEEFKNNFEYDPDIEEKLCRLPYGRASVGSDWRHD